MTMNISSDTLTGYQTTGTVDKTEALETQVLVVLSDNGIEEIPFVTREKIDEQNHKPAMKQKREGCEMRKVPVGRNHSLPVNLVDAHSLARSDGLMDYLQVPTKLAEIDNGQIVERRLSDASMVSKSSLSSFGIYSAPETPLSLGSPSPGNLSPYSVDIHRKFTFPEPQDEQFTLGNFQNLSKSVDAIRSDNGAKEIRSSLKWSESRSTYTVKEESTKRKKSILQRIGSNMSDRSLISRKLRRSITNWSSGQSSKDRLGDGTITFPKTKRSNTRQKFKIAVAKTGQPDGVSFELIDKPGFFLRSKGKFLEPERDGSDSYFNKDSTFVPLPDMWFQGFFAFESVGKPSFFIRLTQMEELTLDRYDGTSSFKEDASFMLKKRPCTTCLQVGVKGWVKMTFGGYCLGKVVAVDTCIEVVFDDGKSVKVAKSSQGCLIPDVVPQANELLIGARVISQWLNRDFLYPGIIIGMKSNEYEIQFDDGDKAKCQAHQIRLVRDHIFQDHSCSSPSHTHIDKQETPKTKHFPIKSNEDSPNFQIKRQQFSKQRQGKLWSRDAEDKDNETRKKVISQKDSLSSNDSQDIVSSQKEAAADKKPLRIVMQNLQMPLLETETMSQDSGYHGYQRQKNLRKEYELQSK